MVHWSPFVMSFKKKYPWIQLAGHAGRRGSPGLALCVGRHLRTVGVLEGRPGPEAPGDESIRTTSSPRDFLVCKYSHNGDRCGFDTALQMNMES